MPEKRAPRYRGSSAVTSPEATRQRLALRSSPPAPDPAPAAPAAAEPAPAPGGGGGRRRALGGLPSTAPIIPVLMIGAGGYLMWFAVKYWRGTGPAVWPSYPIKSVLQGQGLPASQQATAADVQLTAFEASLPTTAGGGGAGAGGGGGGGGPAPTTSGTGRPQHIARLLLPKFGWTVSQMPPLIELWTRESGWNPTIANQQSGALGIAQALGHGGAGTAGTLGNEYGAQYGLSPADARAANSGSALQQIRWGLGYIRSRYGTPSGAWAHEQSAGWY